MKERFKEYLIAKGYREFTPKGNYSTVYDYIRRVDNIQRSENLSWEIFNSNMSSIVSKYDIGGEKEDIGKKSHSAVINALKRYEEFVKHINSIHN